MNFLTGLLIVAILFSSAGTFFVDGITGLAPEVSRTGENGLQAGDQIYKINGWRTYFSGDAQMFLSYSGDTADIEVVRNGRHILVENVARQTCTDQQGEPYQGFGLYVGRLSVPATVSNRIRYTWYQTMDFVQLVWFSLGQLVTGGAGLNDLSGPVGIVTTIKDVGTEAQETAEQNDQNGLLAAAGILGSHCAEAQRWMADGSFSYWWTQFPWHCSSGRYRRNIRRPSTRRALSC